MKLSEPHYPRVSLTIAAVIGAAIFGGIGWLLGGQYEKREDKPALATSIGKPDVPMAMNGVRLLLLLGPSGAGKSFIGSCLQESHNWGWIEADLWGGDGIDESGLRSEWDAFLQRGQPLPLTEALRRRGAERGRRGIVLTLPSGVLIQAERVRALEPYFAVRYVFGAPEHCIRAFLDREVETGRLLPREWWISCNLGLYPSLAARALRPYLIHAFNPDGSRRNAEDVIDDLLHTLPG